MDEQDYVLRGPGRLAWVLLRLMATPTILIVMDRVARGEAFDTFTKKELQELYLWLDEFDQAIHGPTDMSSLAAYQKAREANEGSFFRDLTTLSQRLKNARNEGVGRE